MIHPSQAIFLSGGGLMSPDPGLIFWTILTFLGLVFLLKKTAWGPIIDGLDRREEKIRNSLDEAETARKDAVALIDEQKAELAKARQEATAIIEQGRDAARRSQQEIVGKAQAEAAETLESARREINAEMIRARDQLRSEVVDLSVKVAERLLERSLGDDDHQRLASRFLDEVDESK